MLYILSKFAQAKGRGFHLKAIAYIFSAIGLLVSRAIKKLLYFHFSDYFSTKPNAMTMIKILHLIATLSLTCCTSYCLGQYATSGTGKYLNDIYWLDWSGVTTIYDGLTKNFVLPSGANMSFTFSNVVKRSGDFKAYNVGNWKGDKLDDNYSGLNPIGLATNQGGDIEFTLDFSLSLNGVALPFDIIIADAEDFNKNESLSMTTNGGDWQVLEILPSANGSQALTTEEVTFSNGDKSLFQSGTKTGSYFPGCIYTSQQASSVDVRTIGSGISAIAIGLFIPFDYGDISGYGAAMHYTKPGLSGGYNPNPGQAQTYTLDALMEATINSSEILLGTGITTEADESLANELADGDTDDGIAIFEAYNGAGSYSVDVNVSNSGGTNAYLVGYIDFNDDGDFEDSGEQSNTAIMSTSGVTTLNFSNVPTVIGAALGARFRVGSVQAEVESPTGHAVDGEVEDYIVAIGALPINLRYYAAGQVGEGIELSWMVDQEEAGSYYELQASFDALVWEQKKILVPEMNLDRQAAYKFIDRMPYTGINYYRLLFVDVNGVQHTLFTTQMQYEGLEKVKFYQREQVLNLIGPIQNSTFLLVDMQGKQWKKEFIEEHLASKEIPLDDLAPGIYAAKLLRHKSNVVVLSKVKID